MIITTHVLDTAAGRPAAGLPITVDARGGDGEWHVAGTSRTDADGRAPGIATDATQHRLRFDTAAYLGGAFIDEVAVTFTVAAGREHLHLPLLLSPFGITVYQGS